MASLANRSKLTCMAKALDPQQFQSPSLHVNRNDNANHQSGILVDSGVHFAAGLRSLLHAASQEISSLTAFTSVSSSFPPITNTLYSAIQIRNGNSGTFHISFGSDYQTKFAIEITTDRGSVTVEADQVACIRRDSSGKTTEKITALELDNGVKGEIQAFAESIQNGVANERGVPEQALADLRLIQRMLESDEEGGTVKVML